MTLSTPTFGGSGPKRKKSRQTRPNFAPLFLLSIGFYGICPALLQIPARALTAAADVRVLTALDGTNSGVKETNLGDLVADAAATAGQAQIALIPADEISSTVVQPGSVDPEQIVLALSYYGDATDTVQVMDLSGDQIIKALTRSISRKPQAYPGFLQVSGLRVKVDKEVVTATLANGTALDPAAHYKVAMSAPLAAGELGYFNIWGSDIKLKDTSVSMAQALRNYLANNRQITGNVDNRITEH